MTLMDRGQRFPTYDEKQAALNRKWDEAWDRFEEEGHVDMSEVTEQELISKATGPRVTLEQLEANIASYVMLNAYEAAGGLNLPVSEHLKLLTICMITTKNGFTVTGQSACAWPANYDADIGNRLALEDAKNKLWALMGYHLKETLYLQHTEEKAKGSTDEAVSTSTSEASATWIDRLKKEEAELSERLEKIDAFITGPLFPSLPDRDQRLMIEQKQAMWSYHTILIARMVGIS